MGLFRSDARDEPQPRAENLLVTARDSASPVTISSQDVQLVVDVPAPIPPYDTHPIVVDSGPVAPIDPDWRTLAEYGPEMAAAEAKYGLPAGLVWAVAWRETNGGKHACGTYNAWGWNSCKREPSFVSWEDGIGAVAARLAELINEVGLEGALSTWVSGNARDGQWYAAEVIALLPAAP